MSKSKPNLRPWATYLARHSRDPEVVASFFSDAAAIEPHGCPVIFEFPHLAEVLGLKPALLAAMLHDPSSFYREFRIRKRSGGHRSIVAPYPSLLRVQRWILKNILDTVPVHPACHGFRAGRSIVSNARLHLGAKVLLKLDIKDFFPSIKQSWVIQIFRDLGYSNPVAYLLSSLCSLDGALPQGAATSPALSNIVCRTLDKRLCGIAAASQLSYTRYADDLAVSGPWISAKIRSIFETVIEEEGFSPNHDKTRLATGRGRRILAGVSVSGPELRLPRQYRRKLKQEVFHIKTHGLPSHLAKRKIRDPLYTQRLLGRIQFWLHVEPNCPEAQEADGLLRSVLASEI